MTTMHDGRTGTSMWSRMGWMGWMGSIVLERRDTTRFGLAHIYGMIMI
jgi:hypothetical protein